MLHLSGNTRLARILTTTGALAVLLATPAVSMAKALCIDNNLNSQVLVIPKPKLKPGSNAVTGYFNDNGILVTSAAGAAVVLANSSQMGFSIERGDVTIGNASTFMNSGPFTVVVFNFAEADGKLNIGDVASGYFNGVSASFTVKDCATLPPLP